jgi:hypothetical protein
VFFAAWNKKKPGWPSRPCYKPALSFTSIYPGPEPVNSRASQNGPIDKEPGK